MCTSSVDLFSLVFLWMGWTLSTFLFLYFVVLLYFIISFNVQLWLLFLPYLFTCIVITPVFFSFGFRAIFWTVSFIQFILFSLLSSWISFAQLQFFIGSSLFYKPFSFTLTLLTFYCLVFYENSFFPQAFCTSSKNVCKGRVHFLFHRIVIFEWLWHFILFYGYFTRKLGNQWS